MQQTKADHDIVPVRVEGDSEAVLTYTMPMPPSGATSEWASVLPIVQSGDPDRIKGRTFCLRFRLGL